MGDPLGPFFSFMPACLYDAVVGMQRAVQEARELAAKEAAERAHQEMENDRMEWEERLTWHAYELQVRNLKRMVRGPRQSARREGKRRLSSGVVVDFPQQSPPEQLMSTRVISPPGVPS